MHSIYIKYMKPWLDIERERESNHKKELLLGSQKSKPHKLQTLCSIPMNNRILVGFQIKLHTYIICYILSLFFQVTLQEGCNKILVSDCFTLLQRQFRNLSRGQSVQKETKCGGCGGRIVSQEASSYCDTFVFNCRHAFHIECLADDADSSRGTKCALCDSTNKK